MRINISIERRTELSRQAFTLVEVMIAVLVIGLMFVTLYLGFTQGFGVIQLARENLRATQILQEKMETIRLYTWEQVTNNGFILPQFTADFYPAGTNGAGVGFKYEGELIITNAPVAESYSNDLRLVTVKVKWTSGKVERKREMRTMVSRYGLHNYIY
jgi:prepilin-type N-terminal cleavage/methylation domain-containing protein